MANLITIKRSSVAGKQPNVSDLQVGELALNLADGIIYSKNTAGNVIVVGSSTTSNISEGSNLYFTNARVYANVLSLGLATNAQLVGYATNSQLTLYATNSQLSNYATNAQLINNYVRLINGEGFLPSPGGDEGGQINFANAVTNNSLSGNISMDIYQNKLRIFESLGTNRGVYVDLSAASAGVGTNLIGGGSGTITEVAGVSSGAVSNAQIAAGISTSGILTTGNVVESNGNLYFTNSRVVSALTSGSGLEISANGLLTVTATGSNSSYTDANVYANVILLNYATTSYVSDYVLPSFNQANVAFAQANVAFSQANTAFNEGNINYGLASSYANVAFNQANVAFNQGNINYGLAAGYANVAFAQANVAFDQANVAFNDANVNFTSANTYVNTRLLTKANVFDLNTSNVFEGSNLYFTNTRSRDSITAGVGVIYNNSTGEISIGQNVSTHANVTFATLNVTGNLNVYGNAINFLANSLIINDPLIQLGFGNPNDAVDLGFVGHYNDGIEKHAGFFRDASDGKFKAFFNLEGEPGSTVIDTANASFKLATIVANVFEGNVSWTNIIQRPTTAEIPEGANLYFTNARVYANVLTLDHATNTQLTVAFNQANTAFDQANVAFNDANVNFTSANTYVNTRLLTKANVSDLTTSNVTEGTNLYFNNTRAISALTEGAGINIDANGLITSTVTSISAGKVLAFALLFGM